MYEDLLARLALAEAQFGDKLRRPASSRRLAVTTAALNRRFSFVLPSDYAAFLQKCDGFNVNGVWLGCCLSGDPFDSWSKTNHLMGMNDVYHEMWGRRDVQILGYSEPDVFVVDPDGKNPRISDQYDQHTFEEFDRVERMVEVAILRALGEQP